MSDSKKIMVTFVRMAQEFHAGSKISADLSAIMEQMGHEYRYFPYIRINRNLRRLIYPFFPVKYALSFHRGDEVVIQYPFDMDHAAVRTMLKMAAPLLRLRGVKSTAIIIDLESVRWNSGTDLTEDLEMLNLFQKVTVHSPEMKQMLIDAGYKGEIVVMGLFDYLVSAPYTGERHNSGDICFAGNLGKSGFVGKLNDVDGDVRFNLYGKGFPEGLASDKVRSCGVVSPDDVSVFEGSWGLVWDGDEVSEFSGSLARYMRFNAPHKASLYVSAHLPLIAPSGTAVGNEVLRRGIGITVDSLNDISSRISAVSDAEYDRMLAELDVFAKELNGGAHLGRSID